MKPFNDYDSARALNQGWLLAELDTGALEIQRYDDLNRFASDEAARAYVRARARRGDVTAQRALFAVQS